MLTGTEGRGREGGGGFGGDIELGVIRITMEMYVMFLENQSKREEVDAE